MKFINTLSSSKYDYIIGGAGLAGLTLAYKLFKSGLLEGKMLLLIDPSTKSENDRTWSFWSNNVLELTNLPISNRWEKATVLTGTLEKEELLAPYQYVSINGIDYYNFIKKALTEANCIDWLVTEIITDDPTKQTVTTPIGTLRYGSYFFKSHFYADDLPGLLSDSTIKDNFLWQHFLGYKVRFEQPMFDPSTFVYMDLNVPQQDKSLTFAYVLPETENTALIEYTVFSATLLTKAQYETELKAYIQTNYGSASYVIEEVEFNRIPMTTALQEKRIKNRVPIGTLAGVVKASTGYSFMRNQQHSDYIVKQLLSSNDDFEYRYSKKHRFYDKVLINVIASGYATGKEAFKCLYENNDLKQLFKFLDEETSFLEDIKIMNTVPKWPFTKSGWKALQG